jgi:hypothetical protein
MSRVYTKYLDSMTHVEASTILCDMVPEEQRNWPSLGLLVRLYCLSVLLACPFPHRYRKECGSLSDIIVRVAQPISPYYLHLRQARKTR